MDICDCMCTQNENGDSECRRCHGDIYGCDCPLTHNPTCEKREESIDQQERVLHVNNLVKILGLSRTYKVVKRE